MSDPTKFRISLEGYAPKGGAGYASREARSYDMPREPRSIVDIARTLDTAPIDAEARLRRFRERHPDVVAFFEAVSRLPESRLDALATALVNYTPGQGMAAARAADRETRLIERVWHRRPGSVDRARRLWHFWGRTIPIPAAPAAAWPGPFPEPPSSVKVLP